jgi:hypothetical protein
MPLSMARHGELAHAVVDVIAGGGLAPRRRCGCRPSWSGSMPVRSAEPPSEFRQHRRQGIDARSCEALRVATRSALPASASIDGGHRRAPVRPAGRRHAALELGSQAG